MRTTGRTPWRSRFGAGSSRPDWSSLATNLRHLLCVLTAACSLASAPLHASDEVDRYQRLEEMHHTAWTGKDGLSGRVDCLAQTADGYLWIGTSNGLFRFDGFQFERFTAEEGRLPAANVDSLLASRDGGLWVGYSGGGVSYIGPDRTVQNYGPEQGFPVSSVRALAQDHDGVVWAAVVGGLARFEDGRWHVVRLDWNYPCRSAYRLFVGTDGTLWASGASPDRLLYLRKGSRKFEDTGLALTIWGFVQLDASTVLFSDSSTSDLHEVRREADGTLRRKILVPQSNQHPMALDRDGGVWFLSEGVTRRRFVKPADDTSTLADSPVERIRLDDGLSGRVSNDLLIDREGTLWVVTDTGLDRFRRRNVTWKGDPRIDGGASLVTSQDGAVWVVGRNQLWRADDGTAGPVAPVQVDRGLLDTDGSIWLSGVGAFLRWANGTFERVSPPDELVARGYNFYIQAAAKDRQGRLWASVNGVGQFYLKDARWTFVPILPGKPDMTAGKAHVDAADRTWLSYVNEVARVDQRGVRVLGPAEGLDLGPVLALNSHRSTLWVGAEMGLAFEKDDRFHVVRNDSGQDFGAVADIVSTEDGLWLSSAAGIVHIRDPEIARVVGDPSHRVRYDLFDLVSDLPEPLLARRRYLAATAGQNRTVWFVTNNGIAKVDPRGIVRNSVVPPVAIRAVFADDMPFQSRGIVSLPALTRTLRIDYTALSLAIPERILFRYRLEGWETGWHDAGTRRTVEYTDLDPGAYTFRVLAANNDGVWNETGTTLAFTVAPAWFQTTWFQALVLLSLGAAIAAGYRLRLRSVSLALRARYDERLAERTRIARELHDTLLQTVQGSKIVADDALDHASDPEHVRRALTRLTEWLGRAVDEGRAALNSLRASTTETNDLVEALKRAAEDPTKPGGMSVSVVAQGQSRALHPIVRDEIYRIAHEAIRNAYQHSGATRLDISVEYTPGELRLRIADNGTGIQPPLVDTGRPGRFGIPGMRERASRVGGNIVIASSESGTRITLSVPARSAFQADTH